jgi:hypothetical protein
MLLLLPKKINNRRRRGSRQIPGNFNLNQREEVTSLLIEELLLIIILHKYNILNNLFDIRVKPPHHTDHDGRRSNPEQP